VGGRDCDPIDWGQHVERVMTHRYHCVIAHLLYLLSGQRVTAELWAHSVSFEFRPNLMTSCNVAGTHSVTCSRSLDGSPYLTIELCAMVIQQK
jgi:hypothetical protein